MASLRGHLLVASDKLVDPNFYHAVVLMVQHDEAGALGVVLNRPLPMNVRDVLDDVVEGEVEVDGPLHQGGPCEGPLMVVHGVEAYADTAVAEGLYFSTDRGKIEALLSGENGPMKFFANYSGWTAGQLESEVRRGDWQAAPATAQAVFHGDAHLWTDLTRAIARAAVQQGLVDPKRVPDDPSVN
jgi:putative transcriptional regulator